jgi:hypothetical protein
MEIFYAAYGLRLVSSFALPGMPPASGESCSPSLALGLVTATDLERAWSGASGPPEWRGRQGDGRDLVIERGSAGDLLFTYGELARFRLHPQMRRLDCAPLDSGLDWQRVLIGKVIPSISVMLGYEGLHAAAVDSPDGVVAIMAQSGSGKSTLALELLSRGWSLFADDVLTLSEAGGAVRAHPGTPHMNLAEHLPDAIHPQTLGETLGILAGERWMAAGNATSETRPVRMLCLLERRPAQTLGIDTLPPNPLLLAPYMLGLASNPERRRSRFCLYADLIASATLVRLGAGLEHPPGRLADLLEQSLAHPTEPVAGAVR